MITNNPGHLKGFSYVGLHRYSLTFCTDARRHLFADREVVELVVQQLLRTANEQKFVRGIAGLRVKGFNRQHVRLKPDTTESAQL